MERSSKYNTEQRQLILSCFIEQPDKAITIKEILDLLDGKKIGRSTVYRQIDSLISEGRLMRYMGKGRTYSYRLNDNSCSEHYHIKCASCGKLVHLDTATTKLVRESLAENDFSAADCCDAFIMGKCTECKKHE